MRSAYCRIPFFCMSLVLLSLGVGMEAWGASCRVFPRPMQFGQYDPFSPVPLTGLGRIDLKCDEVGLSFRVKLDSGQNAVGFQPRRLNAVTGQEAINYNLYRDSIHSEIWGDGTPPTVIQEGTVSREAKPTFTIYGRIPAGQNISQGSYTDTVRVTVEW